MEDRKKQKLAQLLNDVLAVIELRDNNNLLVDIEAHKAFLQRNWGSVDLLEPCRDIKVKPEIKDKCLEKNLLDFIRDTFPESFSKDDKMMSVACRLLGHNAIGYSSKVFLKHLLNIVICRGVEGAVDSFVRSTAKYIDFKYVALLDGFHIDTDIQVSQGVQLLPIPPFDKLKSSPYLPTSAIIHPHSFVGKTLLVVDVRSSPVFYKTQSDFLEYFRKNHLKVKIRGCLGEEQEVSIFAENFCHALSLSCDTVIRVFAEWPIFSPDEFCNPTYELIFFQALNIEKYIFNYYELKETKLKEVVDIYKNLANLNDKKKNLWIPSYRWARSKTEKHIENQIIELGIALEAIYLSDMNSEVSFRFALRAAIYLGITNEKQKALFLKLRKFYDCRSKVVHGKRPDTKFNINGEIVTVHQLVREVQGLCRESILKILRKKGFPNWDDLLWSKRKT